MNKELHNFMKVIMPSVDGYVGWSKRFEVYKFFRGPFTPLLSEATSRLFKYFSGIHLSSYHCNDGHAAGGGFTGPMMYYGTMPCYLSIRFYTMAVWLVVYRARPDSSGENYSCGDKLYEVQAQKCFNGQTVVLEKGSFENILK